MKGQYINERSLLLSNYNFYNNDLKNLFLYQLIITILYFERNLRLYKLQ